MQAAASHVCEPIPPPAPWRKDPNPASNPGSHLSSEALCCGRGWEGAAGFAARVTLAHALLRSARGKLLEGLQLVKVAGSREGSFPVGARNHRLHPPAEGEQEPSRL